MTVYESITTTTELPTTADDLTANFYPILSGREELDATDVEADFTLPVSFPFFGNEYDSLTVSCKQLLGLAKAVHWWICYAVVHMIKQSHIYYGN